MMDVRRVEDAIFEICVFVHKERRRSSRVKESEIDSNYKEILFRDPS